MAAAHQGAQQIAVLHFFYRQQEGGMGTVQCRQDVPGIPAIENEVNLLAFRRLNGQLLLDRRFRCGGSPGLGGPGALGAQVFVIPQGH